MPNKIDFNKNKKPRNREKTTMILLKAAQSLALEWGYNGLGINVITKTAGYDKQLFYRYFRDWEGLLQQLAPVICEAMDWKESIKIASKSETYSQALTAAFAAHLSGIINNKTQFALLRLEAQSPNLLALPLLQHRLNAINDSLIGFETRLNDDEKIKRLRLLLALSWPIVQDILEGTDLYGLNDQEGQLSLDKTKGLNTMIEALFS